MKFDRNNHRIRLAIVSVLLLVPVFLLAPHIDEFYYPLGSSYSDLTITHFPNLVYLKYSLQHWGQIPLWSDQIFSGYPFFADPLSGLWYPPGWLLLILPNPLGFNLLVLAHIVWAGLGLFLYLSRRGLSDGAALVGALSFELMPKIFAHFGAGHVTLLFAVAWTPWLLVLEDVQRQTARRKYYWGLAVILGLILLADVRWGPFAMLLWLSYSIYRTEFWRNLLSVGTHRERIHIFLRFVCDKAGQVLVAILLASPLLIPLIEYSALATRSQMTPADNLTYSLPVARVLGLFFPDFAGYAEWCVYSGAFGLLALGWAVSSVKLWRACAFWLGVFVTALMFSFGSNFPILAWIVRLPGFNLLRVPSRAYFLAGLAAAIVAAEVCEFMARTEFKLVPKRKFGPGLVVVGLTGLAILLTAGLGFIGGQIPIEFVWGTIALSMICGLFLLRQNNVLSSKAWGVLIVPLLVLDLGGVSVGQVQSRDVQSVLSEGKDAAAWIADQAGSEGNRVYTPSYSLPQQTAAVYHLRQANGIDPLQIAAYRAFMVEASGVPANGYSVTIPDYAGEDLDTVNANYLPDLHKLGVLNVRYIVSEFPIELDGLTLVHQIGRTDIYENRYVYPKAWIQAEGDRVSEVKTGEVKKINYSPNRIEVETDGGGWLVLSEIAYPGWSVTVDGKQAGLVAVMGLLRGVYLPSGTHHVEFRLLPASLLIGLGMALIGWCIILFGPGRRISTERTNVP